MGDRTNLQVTIYGCPESEVNAVLDVLENHALGTDWGYPTQRLTELKLGEQYVAHEASCGSSDEVSSQLQENAPGASFRVWEDPIYEWLGSVNEHTPDLGHFGAECDANGVPQFTRDQIWELRSTDHDVLARKIGLPWVTALDALAEANKGRVLPRTDEED